MATHLSDCPVVPHLRWRGVQAAGMWLAFAVAALAADPEGYEPIVPPGLSPEQRACVNLEPEFSDAFHGQVDRLYLDGFWRFRPELNLLRRDGNRIVARDPGALAAPDRDPGLEQGCFRPEFDDSGWDEMPVPWVWNVAMTRVTGKDAQRRTAFAGLGYYRTAFTVPADRQGKRVILRFASVSTQCTVWLNGSEVGRHVNAPYRGLSPTALGRKTWMDEFELDVTAAVRFGAANTLALRVFDNGQPIEWGNQPSEGGITGPVQVDFREPVHFTAIRVAADPATGQVKVEARAWNSGPDPVEATLAAQVEPFRSRSYTPPAAARASATGLGMCRLPPGESRHAFAFTVADPVAWDVNTPSLYRLRLVDGPRVLGQTRFGFRSLTVAGQDFRLNGHPIYLRGVQTERWGGWQRTMVFNKGDMIRRGCALLKEAGFNAWRDNGGFSPQNATPIVLDICDELGLVVQYDFSPDIRRLDPGDQRAEALTAIKLGELLDADRTLSRRGREQIDRWLEHAHNHPSICAFTGGNEIGFAHGETEQTMAAFLTAFYGYVKAHDLQRRLVTSSAGLVIYGGWKTPVPADYYDYHAYAEMEMGYLDASTTNRDAVFKRLAGIYGGITKPVLLGECIYYTSVHNIHRPDLQALAKNGVLDRDAYVAWANTVSGTTSRDFWDATARKCYAAFAGIRSVVDREGLVRSTAKMSAEFIRRIRCDLGFLTGFMTTTIDFTHWGFAPTSPFLDARQVQDLARLARTNPEFVAQRQALAPLAILPDLHDRQRFAGESLGVRALLLNQQFARPESDLVIELALLSADGSRRCSVQETVSVVPEGARIERTLTLPIPADWPAGDHALHLSLWRGTAIPRERVLVHENVSSLHITLRSQAAVPTMRTVALYDRAPAGTPSTRGVLDALGIAYAPLAEVAGLGRFEVLIIGASSLEGLAAGEATAIRTWLEQGGRIVCFEQTSAAEVPFLPGLRYKPAGNMLFADVIEPRHPGLGGLKPELFEVWNGACLVGPHAVDAGPKAVFNAILVPMPRGVVLAGGQRVWSFEKPMSFGMVAGEVRAGTGLVFFSQALATRRFATDPVATAYLRHVLQYTLGRQWDGSRASALP